MHNYIAAAEQRPMTVDYTPSPDFVEALPLFPKVCTPRLIKPAVKTRLAKKGEFGRNK